MNTYTNLKVGSLGASLALLLSAAAPAALAASAPQAGRTSHATRIHTGRPHSGRILAGGGIRLL